jgi:hypothetical protein
VDRTPRTPSSSTAGRPAHSLLMDQRPRRDGSRTAGYHSDPGYSTMLGSLSWR